MIPKFVTGLRIPSRDCVEMPASTDYSGVDKVVSAQERLRNPYDILTQWILRGKM